jgi:hypothetical protein
MALRQKATDIRCYSPTRRINLRGPQSGRKGRLFSVAKEGAREGRERGNIKKGTRYIPLHPLYRAQTSPTYLGGVGWI